MQVELKIHTKNSKQKKRSSIIRVSELRYYYILQKDSHRWLCPLQNAICSAQDKQIDRSKPSKNSYHKNKTVYIIIKPSHYLIQIKSKPIMQNDNCKIYIKCRKFQYEKPYHSLDAQNKDKSQYKRKTSSSDNLQKQFHRTTL